MPGAGAAAGGGAGVEGLRTAVPSVGFKAAYALLNFLTMSAARTITATFAIFPPLAATARAEVRRFHHTHRDSRRLKPF